MAEPLLTAYRRDVMSRTVLDLLKISVAGAFASKFFLDFQWPVKIGLISAMVSFGLLGFFLCPRKRPGAGEGN